MQPALLLAVLLAGLAGLSHAAAPVAPSVMALGSDYPNVTQGLRLINSSNDELAAYLANPKTVCTFFAPSNTAMTESIRRLGKYAGIAAQNESMQAATFNYHVIPGKALTTADLLKLNESTTRANETLWILHQKGQPQVYSRPDYPLPLVSSNIKAGGCVVHILDIALVPPSAIPLVNTWLIENQALPPTPPRSEWGEVQIPLHKELIEMSEKGIGREPSANATAAAASPAADSAAVAAGANAALPAAAARSAAASKVFGVSFAGVAAAVAAAVVLWV